MSYQSNPLMFNEDGFDTPLGENVTYNSAKNYYKNCYLSLKSQKTIFQNLQPELNTLKPKNQSDKSALMHFKAILPTVINLTYAQVFVYYPFAIPEISSIMTPDLSPEIERFATKLLNCFLALIRFENRLTTIGTQYSESYPTGQATFGDPTSVINDLNIQQNCVMCQICENLVPANLIKQHSKVCEIVYKTSLELMSTDERLKELIQSEEKNSLMIPWPSTQEEAINHIIPTVQVISLIKYVIKVETNSYDAPTLIQGVLERLTDINNVIEDMNAKILIANAQRLIGRKLKDAQKYVHAMDIAQRTRLTKSNVEPKFCVNISEFKFVKRISNGAFARVFLATKDKLKSPVAIKVIPRRNVRGKGSTNRLLTEKNIMLHFNSPYTIRFFYSTIGKHNLYMVMEYLPGGDLFSLLEKFGCFPEDVARNYTAQIVAALEYLRQNNVIHRDLKPDNILLDSAGHLKLVDFGLSYFGVVGRQTDTHESTALGTPDYIAPEIITLENHSYQADYWSLGAMLYEFITGVAPFHDNTPQEIFSNVLCGSINFKELEEMNASKDCIDFIQKLLVSDPKKRLGAESIDEIKHHPWFNGIDWDNLDKMEPPFIPDVKDIFDTSNFEVKHILNMTDDSDIIEDIRLGTDMLEIAEGNFDSQFISKSMSVLKDATIEEAALVGGEVKQIQIQPAHVIAPVQRRIKRTNSFHMRDIVRTNSMCGAQSLDV
ncbi:AGC family protein kinase [Trichomonas vaginalis G3]|uniref:non-specific serine/threonine protein kinase n=1 Tax=Trichomonas vaginalis (strain ATCC PRA-98 / G3) TaxID=412133 RepID=A2EY79_TRIV3|nr:STKc MAST like domain-containing protein [Trichomonas vaginalis G3]EAY02367.1 AGC family protein kinase [Trichomonas vaginalis G3]KAI5501210.1 STKc MAST like domain-containing protein [Trichomonas vaginalis G3]|eukprot:XP_001314667.1 AGC family protein kinase [Trichomonas vaginalis G3]